MDQRFPLRSILSGIVLTIILLVATSVIFTLVLHFTSIREATIHWYLLPMTLLCLFVGGFFAGIKSGTGGWYVGGLTGAGFLFLTWLISFLGFDVSLTWQSIGIYGLYILLAILGGIIGVNMSPQRAAH